MSYSMFITCALLEQINDDDDDDDDDDYIICMFQHMSYRKTIDLHGRHGSLMRKI